MKHTATTTHPLNEWTNTSLAIPDVHPATSLGFTNYLYWQDGSTDTIKGYNISWAAEETAFVGAPFTVGGDAAGVAGTHLSVSALPDAGVGNTLTVFFQTRGEDVTEFTRDWVAGQWTSAEMAIQDA